MDPAGFFAGAAAKTCGVKQHTFAVRSAGGPGECAITVLLLRPPFSLVPSTARSLFGGTKRECGVDTVGSYGHAALTGWKYDTVGRCFAIPAQEPHAAAYIEACLWIALGRCAISAQEPPAPPGLPGTKRKPVWHLAKRVIFYAFCRFFNKSVPRRRSPGYKQPKRRRLPALLWPDRRNKRPRSAPQSAARPLSRKDSAHCAPTGCATGR